MSLSEAAVYVKKFLRYFVIALGGLGVVWALVWVGINFLPNLLGGPKADYAFGVMPKPTIPQNTTSKGVNFVLDTVDGKFPNLPKILAAYQSAPLSPDIMGPIRSTQLAANFGFANGPAVLDSQTYRFTDQRKVAQSIVLNIGTQNFSVAADYAKANFSGPAPNNAAQDLIDQTRSFLRTHSILPDEMSNSKATVTYWRIDGNSSVKVGSIDAANFARVDFFRNDVNSYPIVGPLKDQGQIYVGVKSNALDSNGITEMHYTFWQYSTDKKGFYPLLPVDQAFQNLQNGQASLISPTTVNFKDVRVNKITLAYYQDDNYEPYLEPIYLFDGFGTAPDGSEVSTRFYLPAIDPRYLK